MCKKNNGVQKMVGAPNVLMIMLISVDFVIYSSYKNSFNFRIMHEAQKQ